MLDLPVHPAMTPSIAQRTIPAKIPAIATVKNANASGKTASRGHENRAQHPPTELQRYLAQNRPHERLIGPPPAFQTNVLDVESDIKLAIQRLEEKREKLRNSDATAPTPKPAATKARNEPPDLAESGTSDADPKDSAPTREFETDRLA